MFGLPRQILLLLTVAALAWHTFVLGLHWREASREQQARDFASYYYAAQVAADGGDPYRRGELGAASREDQTRRGVHPFFYPPPSLLVMVWTLPLDLVEAYRVWFWLDELAALATALVLARWWQPLGPSVAPVILLFLALHTGLPNNHVMGQANLPVMCLALLGLQQQQRGRDLTGGALLAAACMWKMAPGLIVAWWLLQRRFKAAFAAMGFAVVLSILALPLVGFWDQWRFYTEVMPGFGSGDYNGLTVGIDLYGNHSLPNVVNGWFPNGRGMSLSSTGRTVSGLLNLALVAGLFWALRRRPADPIAEAGHVGALCVAMLLVPVFTYEHHLVWALPAAVASVAAVVTGRLDRRWSVLVGLSLAAWMFDLQELKTLSTFSKPGMPWLAIGIRELKLASLICMLVASATLGRSPKPQDRA